MTYAGRSVFGAWALALLPAAAWSQLDPLLPLKATRPNVIVALDLSSRMQRDPADEAYLDPRVFVRSGDAFEASLGVGPFEADRAYRRLYVGLVWNDPGSEPRATCSAVRAIGDRSAAFADADARTRLGRAARALLHVIDGNEVSVRFGLVTTRQASPSIDVAAPFTVVSGAPPAGRETDTGLESTWQTGIPKVDGAGGAVPARGATVASDAPTGNALLRRLLAMAPSAPGALLPAGYDAARMVDAPIGELLDDVRAEAARLAASDEACRNTVVVLVTSGADPSLERTVLGDRAGGFLDIGGRRVPIHVVALAPSDADAGQLRDLAVRTGGRYTEVGPALIDATAASEAVAEIVSGVNLACQHAFATFADVNAGRTSYVATTGPVVGTVDLGGALDAAGAPLPATRVFGRGGQTIPQPSNLLVTAGYELPGFAGRLSGFRVYRPYEDESRPTGYRFEADGTRVWTAAAPPAARRNIFTVLPGAGVVPFQPATAALLAPYLNTRDPAALIATVRGLPVGPIVCSTPALLEPPSGRLADPDYAAFVAANAGRRALVFAGADDGMMHAFDARTGVEVWAVIPFNLLPRLSRLLEARPIDAFPYFVGGSPRLADVKDGTWRTYLFFGEGPGGTFYHAFDVTLDGLAAAVPADAECPDALLAWFADAGHVPFRWSFPRYAAFDSGLPPDGDLGASATALEKSVGQTWATPVVGRAGGSSGPFVVVVGSGRLPAVAEHRTTRGGTRSGTTLYMLDVQTGLPLDARDVGNDGAGEDERTGSPNDGLKNALQADPLAVLDARTRVVTAVYAGDLDGRLWRFDVARAGNPGFSQSPRLLVDAGREQPLFGSVARLAGSGGQAYLFIATGSDLLARGSSTVSFKLVGLSESPGGVTRQFEQLLRSAAADGVDEAAAGAPVVAGGVVFFGVTGLRPGACSPSESVLYALTATGGIAYDTNGDRRRDSRDQTVISRLRAGRSGAPVVADRHLFVFSGDRVEVFGDAEAFGLRPGVTGLRVIAWREIR